MKVLVWLFFLLGFNCLWSMMDENLILNGKLSAVQSDYPEGWEFSPKDTPVYRRNGGPNDSGIVVLKNGKGTLRQRDLRLVPGEKYKLSGYFKTIDCQGGAVVIHNSNWKEDAGFRSFPKNSNWTYREMEITLFPSKGDRYGIAVLFRKGSGELQVADLRLTALTEAGRKGASALRLADAIIHRLIPVSPRLNRIPQGNPELKMQWFGNLPETASHYEVVFSTADWSRKTALPNGGAVSLSLTGLSLGHHQLEVSLRHCKSGKVEFKWQYPITIVAATEQPQGIRRLNNLVSELYHGKIENAVFFNRRDGWVFIEVKTKNPEWNLKVENTDFELSSPTGRSEGVRFLRAGQYQFQATGDLNEALVTVRAIPETMHYPPGFNSYVTGNGKYDWEFTEKHILGAITTFCGGRFSDLELKKIKQLGMNWLANMNVWEKGTLDTPRKVAEAIQKTPGLIAEPYEGATLDEFFFDQQQNRMQLAGQSFWLLRAISGRRLYTWVIGKPQNRACHTNFLSGALNAGSGDNRLLVEAYMIAQPDEKTARAYLTNRLEGTIKTFNDYLPDTDGETMIVLGNFTQIPLVSLDSNPEVDYKYYLDMQMNLLANSPVFHRIPGVGYWGSYYADEELLRWAFRLLRHYAIEGNTEMLSKKYGYSYRPGFLMNCDFKDGLKYWNTSGTISAGYLKGYGKQSQMRWSDHADGDTFSIMKRGENSSRISQIARNLVPGKLYSLQFAVADYRDMVAKKSRPRRLGLDVELAGAEIIPNKSFVYVDDRKESKALVRINLHRVIFRATAPEMEIAFNDQAALPGEELALNYIQLRPYFEDKPLMTNDMNDN